MRAQFLVLRARARWLMRPASVNLWCLRLPAGAALGMVALISLDKGWAARDGWWWAGTAGALVSAAFGYLILEARGHGVPGIAPLFRRVVLVLLFGCAHPVSVAAVGLAAVVPAVVPALAAGLHGAAPGELLVLAGAVGLAAGVLLQVLWDDRPVTFPLAHLPWKGRDRR